MSPSAPFGDLPPWLATDRDLVRDRGVRDLDLDRDERRDAGDLDLFFDGLRESLLFENPDFNLINIQIDDFLIKKISN